MPSAVTYSNEDLSLLVGELYMEVRIRAKREDALLAEIAKLQAALSKVVTEAPTPPPEA